MEGLSARESDGLKCGKWSFDTGQVPNAALQHPVAV